MLTRRDFLRQGVAAASLAATLPGLALARTGTDARLVVVILRGALDGLAAVAPYGDPRYASARGDLALAPPDADDGVLDIGPHDDAALRQQGPPHGAVRDLDGG